MPEKKLKWTRRLVCSAYQPKPKESNSGNVPTQLDPPPPLTTHRQDKPTFISSNHVRLVHHARAELRVRQGDRRPHCRQEPQVPEGVAPPLRGGGVLRSHAEPVRIAARSRMRRASRTGQEQELVRRVHAEREQQGVRELLHLPRVHRAVRQDEGAPD